MESNAGQDALTLGPKYETVMRQARNTTTGRQDMTLAEIDAIFIDIIGRLGMLYSPAVLFGSALLAGNDDAL